MRELEPETLTIHTPLCFLTSAWQFPLSAGHLLLPKLANSPPAFWILLNEEDFPQPLEWV